MVNAKFLKSAAAAAEQLVDGIEDQMERLVDGVEDKMEDIEKAAEVHPVAIIAGTIVAGIIVLILVMKLLQKNAEMTTEAEVGGESQVLTAFSVNSAEEDTKQALSKAFTDEETSLTESAAEDQEEAVMAKEAAVAAAAAKAAEGAAKAEEVAKADAAARESEARRVAEAARQEEEARVAREAKEKVLAEAAAKAEEEAREEAAKAAEEAAKAAKAKEEAEAAAKAEEAAKAAVHTVAVEAVQLEEAEAKPTELPPNAISETTSSEKEHDAASNSSNESFEHLEPEEVALAVEAADPQELAVGQIPTISEPDYSLNLSAPTGSIESDEGVVKSELKISLSPKSDSKPTIKRNISRVEMKSGSDSPVDAAGSPDGDRSSSPVEAATGVEASGGVEMTAVLDAMVAAAAGEAVAEAVAKSQAEQIPNESKQSGADFRSVSIKEAKERLVDTTDGKESSV